MGYYFVIGISGFVIGVLTGLLIRRKPTSSTSSNPAVHPTPSGDLIKEVIEEEVDRGVEVHEAKKKTGEYIEDINELLGEDE